MSHTIKITDIPMKDMKTLRAAVARIEGAAISEGHGPVKLYGGDVLAVAAIRLPGWRYPVAVAADGSLSYDNYHGHWGDEKQLKALKQFYSVETAKRLAKMQGYTTREKKKGTAIVLELTR